MSYSYNQEALKVELEAGLITQAEYDAQIRANSSGANLDALKVELEAGLITQAEYDAQVRGNSSGVNLEALKVELQAGLITQAEYDARMRPQMQAMLAPWPCWETDDDVTLCVFSC